MYIGPWVRIYLLRCTPTDPTHPLDPRKIFSPSFCPPRRGSSPSTSEDLIWPTTVLSLSLSLPCQFLSHDPLSDALSYLGGGRGVHEYSSAREGGFGFYRYDTGIKYNDINKNLRDFCRAGQRELSIVSRGNGDELSRRGRWISFCIPFSCIFELFLSKCCFFSLLDNFNSKQRKKKKKKYDNSQIRICVIEIWIERERETLLILVSCAKKMLIKKKKEEEEGGRRKRTGTLIVSLKPFISSTAVCRV